MKDIAELIAGLTNEIMELKEKNALLQEIYDQKLRELEIYRQRDQWVR